MNPLGSGKRNTRAESKVRQYLLKRAPATVGSEQRQRIVPPRPSKNLRRGGGRGVAASWSRDTIRRNKRRFEELARWLQSCITIKPPSYSTGEQLTKLNRCLKNYFKQAKTPARAVWEGPSPHVHIALGIACELGERNKLDTRLRKAWMTIFAERLPPEAVIWKAAESGQKLASYLGKTYKDHRYLTKETYNWMRFCPRWECHFRVLLGREKSAARKTVIPLIIKEKASMAAVPVYSWGKECEKTGAIHGFDGLASPWRACVLPI